MLPARPILQSPGVIKRCAKIDADGGAFDQGRGQTSRRTRRTTLHALR
jgi:hypothetical protein